MFLAGTPPAMASKSARLLDLLAPSPGGLKDGVPIEQHIKARVLVRSINLPGKLLVQLHPLLIRRAAPMPPLCLQ